MSEMTLFSKLQRRLIKEAMIWIADCQSDWTSYQFIFSQPPDTPQDFATCLDSLNSLDTLPWPDVPCVLFSHPIGEGDLALDIQCFNPSDAMPLSSVRFICFMGDIRRSDLWRYRIDKVESGVVIQAMESEITCAANREYHDIYERPRTPKSWVLTDGASEHIFPRALLTALCSQVIPCMYKTKSTFNREFGHAETREAFRHKPIYSYIKRDRVHYCCAAARGVSHSPEPHERNGHVRNLWKAAGVDRMALPRDPAERSRIRAEKRVRQVVIPPTWVGRAPFDDGEMTHEVCRD